MEVSLNCDGPEEFPFPHAAGLCPVRLCWSGCDDNEVLQLEMREEENFQASSLGAFLVVPHYDLIITLIRFPLRELEELLAAHYRNPDNGLKSRVLFFMCSESSGVWLSGGEGSWPYDEAFSSPSLLVTLTSGSHWRTGARSTFPKVKGPPPNTRGKQMHQNEEKQEEWTERAHIPFLAWCP